MEDYRKKFMVAPGEKLKLKRIDPGYRAHHESSETAAAELAHHCASLTKQQILLYAEKKRSVLIVLQALDAGGKDGTINHVLGVLNPQGARVVGFKKPTEEDLAHDFLWRVHPHTPGRGEIAVFNRSHYEDVLVARVHKLIKRQIWEERYKLIRDFEDTLGETGTKIIKFFLHISKEEQLERFGARLDDPARNWKISESDYAERAFWDDYISAFEDALSATSVKHAPWYVIPSNHKWFRNLAVSQIIADTMKEMEMSYPPPTVDLAEIRRKYHAEMRQAKARH